MWWWPVNSLYLLYVLSLLSSIRSDELQILLNIKSALQIQNSNPDVFNTWNSSNSVCDFTGITCHSQNSLVTEIKLSNRNLAGVLPFDSICQLRSLQKLAFGFNQLHGTVSEDLNNCTKLQYLDLGNNFFSGLVPDISSLSELRFLYLNKSGFSGKFPWSSLRNMTELTHLSLGDSDFEKSSFPNEVLNLRKLNWLYLSNCSLDGEIPPAIGNLTELVNLELSWNSFSGSIPAEIGKLQKLWQLELYVNQLTGTFPVGLRNLTALENFDASTNLLEGDMSELRFLTNLVSLQLFENNLSGQVPTEFGEFTRLVNLSIYSNRLVGPLPQSLGSFSNFTVIDASDNFLTGRIPPDMCKKGKLKKLLLLNNNFTGEIPASYVDCVTLLRFRVNNNSLFGVVPAGIWGLPSVNIIDVELNQLEGPITSDIGNAKDLGQLKVGNNLLSGKLPPEISKATWLDSIDLCYNQFSGKIPVTIGELKQLDSLNMQSNKFSGSIPETIGSCDSLSDLNLAGNLLSNEIPSSIGSLPNLNSLNLSANDLSGQIPASLSSLKLSLLDLSYNHLTGQIPQSLSAYNGSFNGNPGLCSIDVNFFRKCSSDSGMSSRIRALIICLSVGLVVLLLTLLIFIFSKKREKDQDHSLKEESWNVKSFHILTFTEDEILDSIKEENLIGKGGSGNVYRATVCNGKEQLAVKHIWNCKTDIHGRRKVGTTTPMLGKRDRKSKQFDAEVETLSSIRHVNVVKLYCSITSEDSSLLVYEYMSNGSLSDRMHNSKTSLHWEKRFDIAMGAAKGLEHLHHGCERPVIHRDVNSSNILLDEFLKPKIADFGLAKVVRAHGAIRNPTTHVVAGTPGYIAPEYGYTSQVNEKSDVYSFGVVLMELVSGKKAIEAEFGDNKDIVNWVLGKLKTRTSIESVVDSTIQGAFKECALKLLRIAILCTSRMPSLRPSMRTVVQMLQEAQPHQLDPSLITK